MSFIREIEPREATGERGAVYAELERQRGKVSNLLKVHSLRPSALRAHLALYMDLMFAPGGLTRRQRELIAVAVSHVNGCAYCVAHHREALSRYACDPALLDAIAHGKVPAAIDAAERSLVAWAVKLTREPAQIDERDFFSLSEAGFEDEGILLANLIAVYFNFVNRIALGLGVEFDEEETRGYRIDGSVDRES